MRGKRVGVQTCVEFSLDAMPAFARGSINPVNEKTQFLRSEVPTGPFSRRPGKRRLFQAFGKNPQTAAIER